ncbi:MAG: hypothetical protein NW202_12975 [Nitrospira sp.]|nr:hypothetical protein [Nitrospira sp.]
MYAHHAIYLKRMVALVLVLVLVTNANCSWLGSKTRPDLPLAERPMLAVLEFGMGIEINSLSSVKSIDEPLSSDQEALLVSEAVKDIRQEARRLLYERLATGGQFRLVPLDEVDIAIREMEVDSLKSLNSDQISIFRRKLEADIVVGGVVLDYGKVRWQWLAMGMFTDTLVENIVIGLATAWNPMALAANAGFNLLTSTPIWFGGGYLFGVAFRPVRVEAWAMDTQNEKYVWESMEVAVYARERLKELGEAERKKKEVQLHVNLVKAMEALGDTLLDEGLTTSALEKRRRP